MPEQTIDVLIVTALQEEYDAVCRVNTGAIEDSWVEKKVDEIHYVAIRSFRKRGGGSISVGVTCATSMRGIATASAAQSYIERLRPLCIAMCGVCAGRPKHVNLGDVVIADRVWQYDSVTVTTTPSKRRKAQQSYRHDSPTYIVSGALASEISRFQLLRAEADVWMTTRPISFEHQLWWILERSYHLESLKNHPDQDAKCPDWSAVLDQHWCRPRRDHWINQDLKLTAAGRRTVERHLKKYLHSVESEEAFRVHVGAIGSSNQLVRDKNIWARIACHESTALGLDMEAAALGAIANIHNLPFVVMKGVMDFADGEKNDHFKSFAARASAECLISFLRASFMNWRQTLRRPLVRKLPPAIDLVFPPTSSLVQDRVFSHNYDSVRQGALYDALLSSLHSTCDGDPTQTILAANERALRSINGRLRFDLILSKTIVLVDTHVLDGRLMQELATSEEWRKMTTFWRERIKDRPMVEIRSRANSLNDAFVGFLVPPTGGNLKRFLFSSLSRDLRYVTQDKLEKVPSERIRSARELLEVLRQNEANEYDIDRMEKSTAYWGEMSAPGGPVKVVKWADTFKECLVRAFSEANQDWKNELTSPWAKGKEVQKLIEDLAKTDNRSIAYKRIKDIEPLAYNKGETEFADDLTRIRIWYDRYYNHAGALQHDAASEWICNVNDPIVFAGEQEIGREGIAENDGDLMRRIRQEGRVVDVSPEFIERLAEMPADDYTDFLAKNSNDLQRWWTEGNPYILASIIDALSSELNGQGKPQNVEEWAEGNRMAAQLDRAVIRTSPLRRVCVHFVVDDHSSGQVTQSNRYPTNRKG